MCLGSLPRKKTANGNIVLYTKTERESGSGSSSHTAGRYREWRISPTITIFVMQEKGKCNHLPPFELIPNPNHKHIHTHTQIKFRKSWTAGLLSHIIIIITSSQSSTVHKKGKKPKQKVGIRLLHSARYMDVYFLADLTSVSWRFWIHFHTRLKWKITVNNLSRFIFSRFFISFLSCSLFSMRFCVCVLCWLR